jgi:DNA-binding CsgD family transcriptional regulator
LQWFPNLAQVTKLADTCAPQLSARPRANAGWDSLTDGELRVVLLVAEGATNRIAAEKLHISLHTVNTHLRSAFSKLEIKSRAELTRLLQDAHSGRPDR